MKKWLDDRNRLPFTLLIISVVLFLLSFIFRIPSVDKTSLQNQVSLFENYLQYQEQDFELTLQDTNLVKTAFLLKESKEDLLSLYNKKYFFYLYQITAGGQYLRFWSSAQTLIPDSVLNKAEEEQFVLLPSGYYFIKRHQVPFNRRINAYAAIRVKSEYFLSDYFKETFPLKPGLEELVDVSLTPTAYPIHSVSGKTLFYLEPLANARLAGDGKVTVLLRVVALFLVFLSIYLILKDYPVRRFRLYSGLLFIGCLLSFRLILYLFRGPLELSNLYLFSPDEYASTLIPSLGDLLLNIILFCWFGVFLFNRMRKDPYSWRVFHYGKRWWIGAVCLMSLLILTYSVITIIRSIISDSKISFDVTNVFTLDGYTVVGFIILAFLCLGYYYFTKIIYQYLFPVFDKRQHLIYLFLAVIGLVLVALMADPLDVNIYICCLLWLLIYTFLFNNEAVINRIIRFNISGVIVWIFLFSVSISMLMLNEINRVELSRRVFLIEKQATQTDASTERLISIADTYLDRSFFASNFHRLYDSAQNKYIRDSINTNNYTRYTRDYFSSLYIYDSLNRPLNNPDELPFETLNTILRKQTQSTSRADLYLYERSVDKFAYITYRQILDSSENLIGSVFIVSNPKRYSGGPLHPELFRQRNDWELSNSTLYSIAVYNNKLLTRATKKYPFISSLVEAQVPKQKFELRTNGEYSELWYRASDTRIVVMARKKELLLETITLFSYLFCSFLFLMAIIQLIYTLMSAFIRKTLLRKNWLHAFTIRGQIHAAFILITVLSFMVIAITTISFFTRRFEDSNADRLRRSMSVMLNEMRSHKNLASLIFEQRSIKDSINSNELRDIITRVADIHGVDANIYDYNGRLLASSQPDVYRKGVLSMQIDPLALYNLLQLRHIEHIQQEQVSHLKYTVIYAPMRNSNGSFQAFLSIPYFTSQQELNKEISGFLLTLINLNAFIFLVTGLVALLIANRITRSFMFISDKMKEINLSKVNETIEWDRDDEIGGLVTEYNKMVVKLQESADSLAESERQGAWREMARQVAHEIKNPLTPMKLSLQYLQKSIDDKSSNVSQLTESVTRTLVEQIDHLSKIAADFSQFANINNASLEVFDLHEVIQPLIILYSKNPDVRMDWLQASGTIPVKADRTQMNRLFTNLFVNAIEAQNETKSCVIRVREKVEQKQVVISVEDNGPGIDQEMRSKIFTPNFTTKSSGTGLGLAMCKNIVEQTGGQITFTTASGKGTIFYISLPIWQSE